ncbi:MAG: methyltransferase domain-containing protein [Deltaproteobacteria bacterium]|nr:MAG: methyltransferase domain-containing protein [Deltaproteobacteria bacterium]
MTHRVEVTGIPEWVDARRLLGRGFAPADGAWRAELSREAAAFLLARLRGIGFGQPLGVRVYPSLKRPAIRAGRTEEARARRSSTPGFTRPGVRLDEEGRFSLTPEVLALRLGERAQGRHVTDLGCGAGGNAIGFARAGCHVRAVERDEQRLALARHNAQVYGVADRIEFVHADAREVAVEDLAFVDPPWGGEYDKVCVTLDALPLLPELVAARTGELWAKVPPSLDARGLDAEAWFGEGAGDRQRVKFLLVRWAASN